MANKPPIKRQDAFDVSGAQNIDTELEAQLRIREERKARAKKAQRPKATYDLTLSLLDAVERIAEDEDISKSDVVAWALCEFLERYEAGEVDLEPFKVAARSLRFACKLELPAKWR
jgi:undecaprenyl pyrophosphate synthase